MMIHTKRVIFMVLPLLFVPLVYGSPTSPEITQKTCCWEERVPGKLPPLNKVTYCQTCYVNTGTVTANCDPKVQQLQTPPGRLPPGVLENLPTIEQVPTTPPPLFGAGNDANIPPTGGIEQAPTPTPQQVPGGGANVPTEGGSAEQPQGADQGLLPLDDPGLVLPPIGEETTKPQQGAQVLPRTGEQSTGPILDQNKAAGPILDPELADEELPPVTEDQVLSKDDEEDDDGPVPPECPLTGPIPPDCTMKPKFPTEIAPE